MLIRKDCLALAFVLVSVDPGTVFAHRATRRNIQQNLNYNRRVRGQNEEQLSESSSIDVQQRALKMKDSEEVCNITDLLEQDVAIYACVTSSGKGSGCGEPSRITSMPDLDCDAIEEVAVKLLDEPAEELPKDPRPPFEGDFIGVTGGGSAAGSVTSCPFGLAIGFNARERSGNNPGDLTSFQLVCDTFNFTETSTAVGVIPLPKADGSTDTSVAQGETTTNGSIKFAACPPDSYLIGMRLANRDNGQDDIRVLQGICLSGQTTNLLPTGGAPGNAGNLEEFICPIGMGIVGFEAWIRGSRNRALKFTCAVPDAFAAAV